MVLRAGMLGAGQYNPLVHHASSSPRRRLSTLVVTKHSRGDLAIRNFTPDTNENASVASHRNSQMKGLVLPQLEVTCFFLHDPSALYVQTIQGFIETPAYPQALHAFYATYVAACFMERVWRFGLPILISLLCNNNSLLPVALLSFAGQLFIFLGSPCIGALMDSQPRVLCFKALSVIQICCMLLCAALVHCALTGRLPSNSGLLNKPWFMVMIFAGAIERLCGLAVGVAFERDWVVLLAGSTRPIALANANAILRRVDLFCEIAGPFLFGILLSRCQPVTCICMAAMAMTASLPLLDILVRCTYKLSEGVLDRPKTSVPPEHQDNTNNPTTQGWLQYVSQPILPASLAYVMLYFNAVLGPGGLMTSFLTQRGLSPSSIGAFRGSCALMGFIATFSSSWLIKRFGILKAGLIALAFQAIPLLVAVGVFRTTQMLNFSLIIFLVLIAISRFGFWVYDMVNSQIFQATIMVSQANLIGSTEMSLASMAELAMMVVAIGSSDISQFGSLVALSASAVIASACIFYSWVILDLEMNFQLKRATD